VLSVPNRKAVKLIPLMKLAKITDSANLKIIFGMETGMLLVHLRRIGSYNIKISF
jgi:hypothetical protein